ncbi:sterile alpha motif domain-containing protein 3 [Numida meleagris]|uniref:sterile alpha motif domain-containing protein 3 n=1 Tax=Numida meleagris TaxID=8996 RepID=UPI000B3E12CC|nr:sterile alpha motif domain-containing protein 3 [Numida meleagris]XP_021246630.1 sterile alpha motif domain-containing protein 3 [Numida meleagris]
MESWSVDQVCNWLRQRNLGELVPKFREEEVNGAALLALNDRMVQQLVKKIGHQAVLMDLINKYKHQKHGLQSFAYACEAGLPTLPEISGENLKLCSARCRTCSYTLPNFPYDVKMVLGEKKYPDHSMRIRMIDCLQADMTKYLAGSLYPNGQQYNIVVGALMQAYPFLNEDGNGFLVWKRALKDRFKYVRRAIEDDEQVLKNKCKFGHRRGQSRKSSSAENKSYDVKVQKEEEPAYLEGDAVYIHINWLKQEYMKTLRNWKEVNDKMNATMQIRRKMICDKTPLKDILRLFPFLRCPYQLFREFQLLTHMDVYQKTVKILEIYSESILSLYLVKNNPVNIMLQENLKQNTEENVLKYMKMTAACLLLPDVFEDDSSLFAAVNEEVKVLTPVLEVKNPFSVNSCRFALYIEKQEVAQLSDCTAALAALVAAFHVFNIQCPSRIQRTLKFLVSLIFEMNIPQAFLPGQVKKGLEIPKHPSVR